MVGTYHHKRNSLGKQYFIGLIFLLLVSVVSANQDDENSFVILQGEKIDLSVRYTIDGAIINNQTCSIQVLNSAYNIIIQDNMTFQKDGWYNYSFSTETAGFYFCSYNCSNTNSTIIESCSFIVKEDFNRIYWLYLTAVILFIALLWAGIRTEQTTFVTLSGMVAVFISIFLFTNGFPNLTDTFLTNGLSAIMFGIGAFLMVVPNLEILGMKK